MTRVSYVLSTKNRGALRPYVLSMIRALKGRGDEVIVVDGSDGSSAWEEDDLVDILIAEPDKSSSDALNKGVRVASGEFIRHICDDDLTYREGVEECVQWMNAHPDIGLLVAGGMRNRPNAYPQPIQYDARYGLRGITGACGAAFFVRRAVFGKVGYYDVAANMADVDFAQACVDMGVGVRHAPINLVHHIMDGLKGRGRPKGVGATAFVESVSA
jgi:glycosyltransferase involved in cell wall biosynthesis